jgi:hypothetical protein
MAKVLFEGQASMSATFPAFKEFNPKEHMVGDTAPGQYHPGAIRFLLEAGLWKK